MTLHMTIGRADKCRSNSIYGITAALVCTCLLQTGCFSNRNIDAIPLSRVPAELLAADSKDKYKDISLLRLRQDPPETYMLGPGDVLGVYIKGVLGDE